MNLHTWTGWGGVSHWNALVANLEMHGNGTFYDPRLDDATRLPIAARNGFGHVGRPPLFTEPGWNLHTAAEIGVHDFEASRSPDGRYRTSPLHGVWAHARGGFHHDGRFATLPDVVVHDDQHFALGLTPGDVADLVEYLTSL